ncbi:radical SAM protein [Treponema pedis]|uniref:radical SAM protein n=1 Tax=Treponema pedis TaxID=409322 RepID=UPI003D21939E
MEYKLSMFNNLIDREAETLLFNSRTRALVKLDGAEKNMYFLAMNDGVRISEYAVKNNEFFTDLYTNEFIVEYDKDEFDLLNTEIRDLNNSKKRFNFILAPTLDCNLACSYCYEINHNKIYMNKSVIDVLVNNIKNLVLANPNAKFNIVWYGGEPTLAYPVMFDISRKLMDIIDSQNIDTLLLTNGKMEPDLLNKIINICKISSIQFTIAGDKINTNSRRGGTKKKCFENVMRAITSIKPTTKKSLHINIDKDDINRQDILINDLAGYDIWNDCNIVINAIKYHTSCKSISVKELADYQVTFYRKINKKIGYNYKYIPEPIYGFCDSQWLNSYIFDPCGNLYSCIEDITQPCLAFGNIASQELDMSLKKRFYPIYDNECKSCSVFPLCLGGCPRCLPRSKAICNPLKYNLDFFI